MRAARRLTEGKRALAARGAPEHSLLPLQREMSRLIEGFFRGLDPFTSPATGTLSTSGALGDGFVPRVNVVENDKEVRVTAELPGMDEKDVEVLVSRESLTLRGEKQAESEEKRGSCYRYERSCGAFNRTIPLPPGVMAEKASAEFRKGVMTVRLPKSAEAAAGARKIAVRPE